MVRNGIPIILSKQQFESYDFNRGRKMYSKHMGKVIDIDRNFFFATNYEVSNCCRRCN